VKLLRGLPGLSGPNHSNFQLPSMNSATSMNSANWRREMKLILAAIATAAMIGTALPAYAEEVGVGAGPVGVTVGEGHSDRDRDVVRERGRSRARTSGPRHRHHQEG
jgi:hypothetical protein